MSQAWAECLGGLVYVNAIKPGAPAILGAWPFVSDLRTGSMSGGSPEQGLVSAGCAQMGLHFDLPFGTAGGMSDSKFPDYQGGAERAYTLVPPALADANIIFVCLHSAMQECVPSRLAESVRSDRSLPQSHQSKNRLL